MPYDEGLAQRIRELFEDRSDVTEKKMFGGVAFLLGGNMCAGVVRDELMVRVGPDAYEKLLGEPHAREMDFTGRAMRGMIYVGVDGFAEDEDLEAWVAHGLAFARSLPEKKPGAKKETARKKAAKKRAAKKKAVKRR